MSVPRETRDAIQEVLWERADELRWLSLSPNEKARFYELWTRDPEIGGTLSRFIDVGQVRVYIKDTLLKAYSRDRLADPQRPLRALGVESGDKAVEEYIKPHGRRFVDGRVVCWGRADDWKTVLMAAHERAFQTPQGSPAGVVLLHSSGRYHEARARAVVDDVSQKLGIQRIVWLD